MSPELLLQKFGYLGVFFGTALEGETVLVLAGFFASQRYLSLSAVITAAFSGSYSAHLFWFWLGRSRGVRILKRYPNVERHFSKGVRLLERWGAPAILMSQFLYGLRITCSIVVGISRVPAAKFLVLQAIGCATWATAVGLLGYFFGHAVEQIMGRAAHVEKYGIAVLLLIAVAIWLYQRRKSRREALVEKPQG
jgi:membrane protein DedA with SNARE-associated domain